MMRTRFCFAVAGLLALLLNSRPSFAGDVVDRVVARVNGHVIFLSDWDEEICFEAFVDARPPGGVTPEQRQGALDRLIDRELMREQLRLPDSIPTDSETVRTKVAEIRAAHNGAESETGWKSVLSRYGLAENDVSEHLASEMNLMQSIDNRLRPNVQIDAASVETYYREKFGSGAPSSTVPLSEVAGQIREVLVEQKLNDLMNAWLQTLRSEGEIHTFTSSTSSGGQAR